MYFGYYTIALKIRIYFEYIFGFPNFSKMAEPISIHIFRKYFPSSEKGFRLKKNLYHIQPIARKLAKVAYIITRL